MHITTIIIIFLSLVICFLVYRITRTGQVITDGTIVTVPAATGVTIKNIPEGAHINIVYQTSDEAPTDYELMPGIVGSPMVTNEPTSEDRNDREFWAKVADFKTLEADEQERVVDKLIELGVLKACDKEDWLFEGNDGGQFAEEEGTSGDGEKESEGKAGESGTSEPTGSDSGALDIGTDDEFENIRF